MHLQLGGLLKRRLTRAIALAIDDDDDDDAPLELRIPYRHGETIVCVARRRALLISISRRRSECYIRAGVTRYVSRIYLRIVLRGADRADCGASKLSRHRRPWIYRKFVAPAALY